MTLLTWMSFFALLGSAYIKAAHRMLMKLTPDIVLSDVRLKSSLDENCFLSNGKEKKKKREV